MWMPLLLLLAFLSRQILHSISICIQFSLSLSRNRLFPGAKSIFARKYVCYYWSFRKYATIHTHIHSHTHTHTDRFNQICMRKQSDTYIMCVWNAIMWIESVIENRERNGERPNERKEKKHSNEQAYACVRMAATFYIRVKSKNSIAFLFTDLAY